MLFMCDQLLGALTHLTFFYSDISLFFIGDASWKLCNIWFLFCENNSRSITILELNINAVPHPSSSCQLWNHKVRVYSSFASVFNLMKDTPVQLLAQISNTLDKNISSKWNIRAFEWFGKYSQDSSCHTSNCKSVAQISFKSVSGSNQSAKIQTFDFTKFLLW